MTSQRRNPLALAWAMVAALTLAHHTTLAVGEDYIGIGYNILYGNPDGGMVDSGGVDPGLLLTRPILDLNDRRAIMQQRRHSCAVEQSVNVFYGTKSYQNKLSTDVDFGVSFGIPLLQKMQFSLSSRFQQAHSETLDDHKVFRDEKQVCNLGQVRYAEELSEFLNVTVTDSFASSVCALPPNYDEESYMAFLDTWGTHVTVEVDLGTRQINRSRTSLAEYVRHVMHTSNTDVSLGGAYMGAEASLDVNFDTYKSRDSYSASFGSHYEYLEVGTKLMPEPITVRLESMASVLRSKYWTDPRLFGRGICQTESALDVITKNLRVALNDYAHYKKAALPEDPVMKVPLTWPRGTYGLMKPLSGCPENTPVWTQGWRYEDIQNLLTTNLMSDNLHLAGQWPSSGNFRMDFCIKGQDESSEFDVDWPAGDYCILKYGNCPKDFHEGFIQFDDEYFGNTNSAGGSLPDGVYDDNTLIRFCCRNDSMPVNEIYLPPKQPFFLLRHTRACQTVHRMSVREESVQWYETVSFLAGFSKDQRSGGWHPYDDGQTQHRLHFCYYYPAKWDTTHANPMIG